MMPGEACELPSQVFENMRFLSVHVYNSWSGTIRNLNHMLLLHNVIAASETKVENALRAEAVFFCHVEGCQACIGQGMAFVVKAKWAEEHGIFNRNVSEPIPGVATSLR